MAVCSVNRVMAETTGTAIGDRLEVYRGRGFGVSTAYGLVFSERSLWDV